MNKSEQIKGFAIETIDIEANALLNIKQYINDEFAEIVHLINVATGRVIVTGIGKSAIIANKIVATFNSTGTPALFMHAADAIHGDLGMVLKDDILICISKSGSSPEIKVLVPLIKERKNTLIGLVGNVDSYLSKQADYIINSTVEKEACPNNLAPTSSTTAQLALGDALAVSLLQLKNFGANDFAKHHPGGALGKKLYLKVAHLANLHNKPQVNPQASIKEVIAAITQNRLGATVVLDENKVVGIITDGDIRRMIESNLDIQKTVAKDIMGTHPRMIESSAFAVEAYQTLQQNSINHLIVVNQDKYEGIVHIQDIIKEGIV